MISHGTGAQWKVLPVHIPHGRLLVHSGRERERERERERSSAALKEEALKFSQV